LFNPALTPEVKKFVLDRANLSLAHFDKNILAGGKTEIVPGGFSAVDAYAYIILSWHPYIGVSLDAYPNVKAYYEHVKGLDFIKAAHAEMGARAGKAGYTF
jgi:glutathione S-transferase